jgi:CRP/FNR family cyclic AMP-dependent transcriptional regulator
MTTDLSLLAGHAFLAGIEPRHLARMATLASPASFPAGGRIFNEGAEANAFWLIRDGRVNLETHLPARGDVVVETIGPGQVLGWSWLFPPYLWHFAAAALDDVAAVRVEAAGMRALCDDDPALGYQLSKRFMSVVVERMQATRLRLLDLYGGAL